MQAPMENAKIYQHYKGCSGRAHLTSRDQTENGALSEAVSIIIVTLNPRSLKNEEIGSADSPEGC
jgi:hypothetical protein